MHVLVTGPTGFVGRSVTMALVGDGHQVHGLVRDPGSAESLRKAGVALHAGDMRQPGSYVPLVGQVDAVVQAAQLSTAGRVTAAKARAVFAAEHIMTSALSQACLDQHKRLVYTGGCFDWGDHGEAAITEQTPLSPSPMGVGHAREADALQKLHDEHGLDVVRLNPGFVYGPGGLLKTALVDQARRGRLRCIGPGRNWWSCVHVEDLGRAYAAALATAAPGSYYAVADDEPIRLRDLTDVVTDAMKIDRVGSSPPWLVALFAGRPLVASLVTSFRVDATRIRDELHWRPAHHSFRESGPAEVSTLIQARGQGMAERT
jgi:nucleoside-diphosphate-sugar epimerase